MTKNDIGMKAGNIFLLLLEKGKMSIREIGDFTHDKDRIIFLALGWLLRENKVRFLDRNGLLCVEINNPVAESVIDNLYNRG